MKAYQVTLKGPDGDTRVVACMAEDEDDAKRIARTREDKYVAFTLSDAELEELDGDRGERMLRTHNQTAPYKVKTVEEV